jgi:hypothetical protein
MTSSFDELYENLLVELTPVSSEYDTFSSSLERNIGAEKTGGYLIKDIAEALDISKEEAVKMITRKLYDEVFGDEGVNPSNTEDDYRKDIATALKGIVDKIKDEHPEAKSLKNYEAYRGYTARIISKLADSSKDFSENVSKGNIKTAIEDAAAEAEGDVGSESPDEEDDQESITSEFGDQDTLEEPEANTDEEDDEEFSDEGKVESNKEVSFSERTDYFVNPEDDIKAGTLSGDLRSVYDKLGGMAGETNSGEDIADRLRKAGVPPNKVNSYLKQLISKGVLEPQGGGSSSGEALESSEENMRDVERREMERPSFQAAYNDYLKSGGAELSGRESNYE